MESPAIIIETQHDTYLCDTVRFAYDNVNHWQELIGITIDKHEVNIHLYEVKCIKPAMGEPIAVISLN